MISSSTRTCIVCAHAAARYTCPKCRTPFCTLDCYKIHSKGCTEEFYQGQVVNALKSEEPVSKDQRQAMLDILKRQYNIECGEVDGNEKLSEMEHQDFLRAVVDGRLAKYIEVWDPWWLPRDYDENEQVSACVEVMGSEWGNEAALDVDRVANFMLPDWCIPDLHTLLRKKEPSPLLVCNLVSMVYAYVVTMRLYNGDVETDLVEALSVLFQVAPVFIEKDLKFQSISSALIYSIERSLSVVNANLVRGLLIDTRCLVSYGNSVARMLSHCHRVLVAACEKPKHERTHLRKGKLRSGIRKCTFFLSWLRELPAKRLVQCGEEVSLYMHHKGDNNAD